MKPIFSVNELMTWAEAQTGLSDWGEEDLRRPLEILCYSLNEEAGLHEAGQVMVRQRLQNVLSTRLLVVEERKRDPAIPRQVISRPLIVLGLPRSGTTHMHALLAADPDSRSPRVWEMSMPMPPPRRESYWTDPRIDIAREGMRASGFLTQELMAIHPFTYDEPEECGQILEYSGYGAMYSAMCWVPTYSCWRENVDFRPAMRFHRKFLQHLQAYCAGNWWVLKSAEYHYHLEEILDVYPDACIVMMHRDPARTVPSEANLYRAMRRLTTAGHHFTAEDAGRAVLRGNAISTRRLLELREHLHDDRRIFDVHYSDLLSRPMDVAAEIYRHFGLSLTERVRTSMQEYLVKHTQNRHGVNRYALEDWGLTEANIERHLGHYIDHYGIRREARKSTAGEAA